MTAKIRGPSQEDKILTAKRPFAVKFLIHLSYKLLEKKNSLMIAISPTSLGFFKYFFSQKSEINQEKFHSTYLIFCVSQVFCYEALF
jgi:hypothetical protein